MNRTDLVDAYFDWLVEKIQIAGNDGEFLNDIYSWTLKKLFNTEFKVRDERSVETGSYDIDRACDGLYLRTLFAECAEVSDDFWHGLIFSECSILEMMIALAARMDNNYLFEPEIGDRSALWFWNMFESLGLMEYDNDRFDDQAVSEILKIFVNRQYYSDGTGGLFTFKNAGFDARRYDIWSQMTRWIGENFE